MASGGQRQDSPMVDEMLDGGQMDIIDGEDSAMSSSSQAASSLLSELAANDRTVHSEFHNKFGIDLFDDKDLK
jgi:hypothetical protein